MTVLRAVAISIVVVVEGGGLLAASLIPSARPPRVPRPQKPRVVFEVPAAATNEPSDKLLARHLRKIAGEDPRDCGHLTHDAPVAKMRAALACALRAAEAGEAFVVVKSDYGVDSWVPFGLVRGRAGPIVFFAYDDFGRSDRIFTTPCTSPQITKPNGRWRFTCRTGER